MFAYAVAFAVVAPANTMAAVGFLLATFSRAVKLVAYGIQHVFGLLKTPSSLRSFTQTCHPRVRNDINGTVFETRRSRRRRLVRIIILSFAGVWCHQLLFSAPSRAGTHIIANETISAELTSWSTTNSSISPNNTSTATSSWTDTDLMTKAELNRLHVLRKAIMDEREALDATYANELQERFEVEAVLEAIEEPRLDSFGRIRSSKPRENSGRGNGRREYVGRRAFGFDRSHSRHGEHGA